jgi:hypothetical protein
MKQPVHVRRRLETQRHTIVQAGDPRQMWLVVRMDPHDGKQGEFFVTHGNNYDKFANRKHFQVLAHSPDRVAVTQAARRATEIAGAAYQPKTSAFHSSHQEELKPLPQGFDMGQSAGDEPSTPENIPYEEPEQ